MLIKLLQLFKSTLIITIFAAQGAAASSTVVGSISSEFSVSGGQVNYSIPIQVAPGRGGMQPDLSLNYTGGGNGVLGVGWSLAGLSSIHRCAATLEQDGFIDGITFTDKDRYCLDGQRLIPVNGVNGGVGTEYKTEVDGYSQIKAYGGSVNHPDYWVAKTKAGQIITFGGGNASLTFAQGTTSWSVKTVNDTTTNNPITYTYFIDQYVQYLDEVNYQGGRIDLIYQDRLDSSKSKFIGQDVVFSKIVDHVNSYSSGVLVSEYQLQYENTGANNQSILTGLSQCGRDGSCLDALDFDWNSGAVGSFTYWTTTSTGVGQSSHYEHQFVDVNGDGLADWIQIHRTSNIAYVGLSNGNGTFQHWTTTSVSVGQSNHYQHKFVDVNGDGLADWIQIHRTSNIGYIGLSNGNGTFQHWTTTSVSIGQSNEYDHRFVDVNGDGLADWIQIHRTSNIAYVGLSNGNGTFQHWTTTTVSVGQSNEYEHQFVDVNNDGLADWIQIHRTSNIAYVGFFEW